jgi:hypothetical protein
MRSSNSASLPTIALENGEVYDRPNEKGSPERNLLLGILERAILDYVGNDKQEAEEANEWLFSNEDNLSPFTFNWVCDQIDLDSVRVRKMIKDMPKRGKNRVAPWYFQKHEAKKQQNKYALCA